MSGRSNQAIFGILICQLIWPGLTLLSALSSLEFYFTAPNAYLLLKACIILWLSLLIHRASDSPAKCLCSIVFPVSIVIGSMEALFLQSLPAVFLSGLNCICTESLYAQFLPPRWYKYLITLLCTLLLIAHFYLCGLVLIFGQIGAERIVQEAPSPDGKKTAQLIDDNQGALGGNTFVYIRSRRILPLLFGALRPDSELIYRGHWGEFDAIFLSWQDEDTLLINGIPHPLS